MSFKQIALDGPAGSGKSTVAKLLAKKLNFTFINSGGFFRAIALYIKQNNIDYQNLSSEQLKNILEKVEIHQVGEHFFLNNEDVTDKIHNSEISSIVPIIAKIPVVREYATKLQVDMANKTDIVIEGRDTTTVMFPNATLKCWVFANPKIRAERRWEQEGKKQSLDEVFKELVIRDKLDTERDVSPMKRADDAFDVDTSNITIDECVEKIANEFATRI